MSIEKSFLNEEEKKKNKLSEKQKKEALKKQATFKKTKEKIGVEVETEDEIFHLKELVEKWVISKEIADKVINWKDIDNNVIKDIFEKLDQIEETKDIDKYLPKELRVTHEDYTKALHDDIFRVKTITKLDSALILLAKQVNPDSIVWLNLFSWFLAVLDKNLIQIQENTIDVKDSLVEIDEKKFWKIKDNRTFWQKIKDFFKDLNK